MIPKKMELVVIKQTAKQYNAVKTQLYRNDVGEIIIATDAGREGELVARWILEKANCRKPIKRLWISSVTDKAIRDGFANLRDGRDYNNLYAAAVSRAEADWLVGINATRALTCKYNAQLSCGRVQTPTLAMIAKREEEIRNFKSVDYYGMTVQSQGIHFTWQDKKSGSCRSFQKEKMESLLNQVKAGSLTIESVEKTAKKTFSPGLYDLTELQRDANKKYGLSAKETLNIMQRLYENHKVLTYPRTDSRYIGSDVVGTLKERLKACAVGPYRKLAAEQHTKDQYEKILLMRKRRQEEGDGSLYGGHLQAVAELTKEYLKYSRREDADICMLCGSIGMGKTMVLKTFIESMENAKVISVEFQVSDQQVAYLAVEKVMEQICDRGSPTALCLVWWVIV